MGTKFSSEKLNQSLCQLRERATNLSQPTEELMAKIGLWRQQMIQDWEQSYDSYGIDANTTRDV